MAQTDKQKALHNQKGYKYYSFGNFYPIEKNKIYKQGNSYKFTMRSLSEEFIKTLSTTLLHYDKI
jgi:CRISPR-associated endoribonuclease Cas6